MDRSAYIRIWLWTGIVLVATMVVIGGITRLTGSGLSIVQWKVISGTLPPLNEHEWQEAFDQYKQFPEYQKLNGSLDLAGFKSIFFWEYVHRLLGRLLGVVFLLPFIFFLIRGWMTAAFAKKVVWIFVLGGLQGVMGWYMVKSGLVDNPHVSHFRLAAHQSLAMLLMVVILWTLLTLKPSGETNIKTNDLKASMTWSVASIVLLLTQLILGAFVAGLKAGYAYTNFPLMGDSFGPPQAALSLAPPLYNGVLLQFIHRWVAFAVLFSFLGLLRSTRHIPDGNQWSKVLLWVTGFQVALGILTLMLRVPIVLGGLHQFVAVIVLLVLVRVIFSVFSHKRVSS